MHMHKSRIDARYSVGLDAFLVKMTFLTPVTPSWPLTPPLCLSSGQGTGHFDQV